MAHSREFLKLPAFSLKALDVRSLQSLCPELERSYTPLSIFNLSEFFSQFDREERPPVPKEICPFFVDSSCRFAVKCRNYHPATSEGHCAICKVAIKQSLRKYGVLSGCNCTFCLPCIRQRRTRGNAKENNRKSCPVCATFSEHLVSSPLLVVQASDKDKLVRYLLGAQGLGCKTN